MQTFPTDPRAVIEIERPGFTDGQGKVVYDSRIQTGLFEDVTVELVTNESSQSTWSFFDPKFRVIDAFAGNSPVPMSVVRVFLGYGDELGDPVFKGLLAKVEREAERTLFTAYDMGFKM